jgi:hypothetical protein
MATSPNDGMRESTPSSCSEWSESSEYARDDEPATAPGKTPDSSNAHPYGANASPSGPGGLEISEFAPFSSIGTPTSAPGNTRVNTSSYGKTSLPPSASTPQQFASKLKTPLRTEPYRSEEVQQYAGFAVPRASHLLETNPHAGKLGFMIITEEMLLRRMDEQAQAAEGQEIATMNDSQSSFQENSLQPSVTTSFPINNAVSQFSPSTQAIVDNIKSRNFTNTNINTQAIEQQKHGQISATVRSQSNNLQVSVTLGSRLPGNSSHQAPTANMYTLQQGNAPQATIGIQLQPQSTVSQASVAMEKQQQGDKQRKVAYPVAHVQTWDNLDNPYYRITYPLKESMYAQRLECLLMSYLQKPLTYDPSSPKPGWFQFEKASEVLIFHKMFPMEDEHLFHFGIRTLPGLDHVEISIYVFKDTDTQLVKGRKHYRVDALAVCFDSEGRMIGNTSGDLCRGFLSFQWYNDKMSFTRDWDKMDFGELLQLLRRTAKRNYDEYGDLRTDEAQLRMDTELGEIFPRRGDNLPRNNLPPLAPEMLYHFKVTPIQQAVTMQPQLQGQISQPLMGMHLQPQGIDMHHQLEGYALQESTNMRSQPQGTNMQPQLQEYALQASTRMQSQQQGYAPQASFDMFQSQQGEDMEDLI